MSEPLDSEVETAAINRILEQLSLLSRRAATSPQRSDLIACGYPSYLPDMDELIVDLIAWRDRVAVGDAPLLIETLCASCKRERATTRDPFGGDKMCGKCGRKVFAEFFHVQRRGGERVYQLRVEGEEPLVVNLPEFCDANELEGEDLWRVYNLPRGGGYRRGGGAAPIFDLQRVQ